MCSWLLTPTYDNNGNVLSDTAHTYAWDAYGRPVGIDSVALTFDALGRMAEDNKAGTYTQFVYSPSGQKLALMNGSTLVKAFIPLAGGSSVVYNASGIQYYRHTDWLGTYRFGSTTARAMYWDGAIAPYGEVIAESSSTDTSFTGITQDVAANLFDFPAREFNAIHGRWPTPDPAGVSSVSLRDPQTLNRYAYVRNSPLSSTDPTGMYCDLQQAAEGCGQQSGFSYSTDNPYNNNSCNGVCANGTLAGAGQISGTSANQSGGQSVDPADPAGALTSQAPPWAPNLSEVICGCTAAPAAQGAVVAVDWGTYNFSPADSTENSYGFYVTYQVLNADGTPDTTANVSVQETVSGSSSVGQMTSEPLSNTVPQTTIATTDNSGQFTDYINGSGNGSFSLFAQWSQVITIADSPPLAIVSYGVLVQPGGAWLAQGSNGVLVTSPGSH